MTAAAQSSGGTRPGTARPPGRPGGGPGGGHAAMMPVEKASDFRGSAGRVLRLLRPRRLLLTLGVTLMLVSVAASTMGPRIIGHATDLVFAGVVGSRLPAGADKASVVDGLRAQGRTTYADLLTGMDVTPGQGVQFDAVGRTLLLALALYVVSSLLMWVASRCVNHVTMTTMRSLRADAEAKLHRLPLSYVDRTPRGDLLSRVTNDVDNLAQSLQQTFGQLLNSLFTVVAILVFMLLTSPLLTLIALAAICVSAALTRAVAKRSRPQFVRQWERTGALNAQIEEAFTGHELVTVFGRRDEVLARVEKTNDELYDAAFRAQFVSGLMMPLMMFVGNLSFVAVAVAGGLQVTAGRMTVGGVQAFIQYSRSFTQPLAQMASMANLVQSGIASAERVFAFLDAPEESPEPSQGPRLEHPRGRIEFDDVTFSYSPGRPLIEHLSLVAEPGQTVAIVGPTGAGKTTLVNLVMRFYELDGGRITLDGVDIATLSRQELRRHTGMVLQDTWLFKGTIRDNIAYGNPQADDADVLAAARATYVDRFVQHLPDGYDTVLDDDGANVSVGEKQLITIARAFLSRPSLLILDEATSSVDTRTELLLQQAMAALRSDRTSFVIAHRLSTIRDADLILVMESGAIVEQGTHDELLRLGGAYARLYQAQFRGSADASADAGAPPPGAVGGGGAPAGGDA